MKNITLKALIVLAGVLPAAGALAQESPLRAKVPFAFSVDNKVLPAGRYEVQQVSNQLVPGEVLVRNLDRPKYSAMILADQGSWEDSLSYKADKAQLVFDEVDGQYFLHEVRGPLDALNLEFATTKTEKTARTVASNATQTTIVSGE